MNIQLQKDNLQSVTVKIVYWLIGQTVLAELDEVGDVGVAERPRGACACWRLDLYLPKMA